MAVQTPGPNKITKPVHGTEDRSKSYKPYAASKAAIKQGNFNSRRSRGSISYQTAMSLSNLQIQQPEHSNEEVGGIIPESVAKTNKGKLLYAHSEK